LLWLLLRWLLRVLALRGFPPTGEKLDTGKMGHLLIHDGKSDGSFLLRQPHGESEGVTGVIVTLDATHLGKYRLQGGLERFEDRTVVIDQ
jgi:hypothetical protein